MEVVMMCAARRQVVLDDEQRRQLKDYVTKGKHPSRSIRRAQILIYLDAPCGKAALSDAGIAAKVGVSRQTVQVVKRGFLENGLDGVLQRKRRKDPPVLPKADGDYEARLIALCCSDPPQGYARWTVRLLADKSVELGYIDSITPMTVSRVLKKTNLSLT
jgi:transposase